MDGWIVCATMATVPTPGDDGHGQERIVTVRLEPVSHESPRHPDRTKLLISDPAIGEARLTSDSVGHEEPIPDASPEEADRTTTPESSPEPPRESTDTRISVNEAPPPAPRPAVGTDQMSSQSIDRSIFRSPRKLNDKASDAIEPASPESPLKLIYRPLTRTPPSFEHRPAFTTSQERLSFPRDQGKQQSPTRRSPDVSDRRGVFHSGDASGELTEERRLRISSGSPRMRLSPIEKAAVGSGNGRSPRRPLTPNRLSGDGLLEFSGNGEGTRR
jgi:hypothetical protein